MNAQGGEMRRIWSIWLGGILSAGFTVGSFAGCSSTTPIKLVGLVQTSKTDDGDNPIDIYLWDGKVGYPIDENAKKTQLLEKVDSKIEAEGEMTESYGGKKTIVIEKYRILREALE